MTGPSYLSSLIAPETPALCELLEVVDRESGDTLAVVAVKSSSDAGRLLDAVAEASTTDLHVAAKTARWLLAVEVSTHCSVFATPCDPVAVGPLVWAECRSYYLSDEPKRAA